MSLKLPFPAGKGNFFATKTTFKNDNIIHNVATMTTIIFLLYYGGSYG